MKSNLYKILIVVIATIFIGSISGCDKKNTPVNNGSKSANTKRVITFSPAITQIARKLGKQDLVVGVDKFSYDYLPVDLKKKIKIAGDMLNINSEIFISLNPTDVIFQSLDTKKLAHIREFIPKTKVSVIKINNLQDITNAVKKVGDILDAKKQADQIIANFERKKLMLKGVAKDKPSVLFMSADYNNLCAGEGTFIDDLLKIAGAKNAAKSILGNKKWKNVEVETIINAAPEVMIVWASNKIKVEKLRKFWQKQIEIPAVKNKRLYFVTDPRWVLPGADYAEIIPELIKILTPVKRN